MPLDMRDTFPLSHDQAVRILLDASWNDIENEQLDQACLAVLHASFHSAMLEFWHLDESSFPLPQHYRKKYGIGGPDDMSSLIILDFLARRRGEEQFFDLIGYVRLIKRQWLEKGLDPLTLQKVS